MRVFTLLICVHEEAGSASGHGEEFRQRKHGQPRVAAGRKEDDYDWEYTRWLGGAWRGCGCRFDRHGASLAVGRNPGAATPIMVQSILSIAFAEAIVFYALFLVR